VPDLSPVHDPGLLILISLADGPKHGHAMMRDVERFAGVRMGPGTLYGALTRLDGEGLVEPLAPDGRRRPYRLTAAGMDALRSRLRGMGRAVSIGLERVAQS
jgi:DNA-binding PadR family transcriptional regulator